MDARSRFLFLVLVLAQAAHSGEEYAHRLYDVFAPARYLAGLVNRDPGTGFVIANTALVLFGLWCYLARVRPGHASAQGWAWLWVFLEAGNGVGHPLVALSRGGYFPGVITAVPLLVLSIWLAARLLVRHAAGRTPA